MSPADDLPISGPAATTNGVGGAPELPAASPAVAPAAAPTTPEPASTPVAAETPAPAATEAPMPSLLQEFDTEQAARAKKAEPAAPAKPEAKPAAEAAKPEAKPGEVEAPTAPAAPEPIAYEYTLPPEIKLDDAQKATFHKALDDFRADPVKGMAGLIEMHKQAMTDYAMQLAADTYKNQVAAFNQVRQGWRTKVMGDEELGGAGYQTTMGAVARMRDKLIPTEHRAEFNDFLETTGAGDHPALLRLLHRAARYFDEAPMPPPGARPPPNQGLPKGRGLRSLYRNNNGSGQQ